jgi:OOP family OmpA-OmpF porin
MKKALLPLGLAALAILAFLCIRSHAPFIEKDIHSRTEAALKSAGFQFAAIRVDGRDVRLEGAAPSEAALKAAAELAAGVRGVRWVDAAMTIAKAPEPPAPVAAKAAEPPAPRKWVLAFDRLADKVVLSGMFPNEAMRDRFVQILQSQAGAGGLDQRIDLAPESPETWQGIVAALARYLDDFTRMTAELSGDALRIGGEMKSDKVRSQFIQFIQASLPPGVAAAFEVTIPSLTAAAVSCQQALDDLLSTSAIRFDTASTAVSPQSMDLLRQLAAAAQTCPKVRLKIAGHTDASGSEEFNLKLSQGRAESVAGRLAELGVEPGRIVTMGYGEARPVAGNDTEEGRALNRRIEFIITED